jgi:hypothetical protein
MGALTPPLQMNLKLGQWIEDGMSRNPSSQSPSSGREVGGVFSFNFGA